MTQSVAGLAALLDSVASRARAQEAALQAARTAKARVGSVPVSRPEPRDGSVRPEPHSRVRVVLLAPDDERVRLLGILYTYAARHALVVDSVAGTISDALAAVSAGLADRIVAVDARALGPLIEIADPQVRHARADLDRPSMPDRGTDVPASQRRPRRLT